MNILSEEEIPRSLEEANKLLCGNHLIDGCMLLQRLLASHGEKLFKHSTQGWLKNFLAVLAHTDVEVRRICMEILTKHQHTFVAHESIVSPVVRDVLTSKSLKKDMLQLIKAKEELFALELWEMLVIILGKALHKGSTLVNALLEVVEKCMQSRTSSIVAAALLSWKELIRNFTSDANIGPARVRLLKKPLGVVSHRTPEILLAKCNSVWFLVCSLGNKLIDHFELCVALLQLIFTKQVSGDSSKVFSTKTAAPTNPANCQEALDLGCNYLIEILEQVQVDESPSTSRRVSTQLNCSIPRLVIRKHTVAFLKAAESALNHLNTAKKSDEIFLLVKLLIEKLDLMCSTDVKEEIEETVLFLKIVQTFLKENHLPSALPLELVNLVVHSIPVTVLWSPLYQLDCTDMTSGVPAITFLQLMFSTMFTTSTSHETFLSVFKKLISTSVDDTAFTLIERTLKFLHNQSEFSDIPFQMWDLVLQQLLTLLSTKNQLELDYWKSIVEDTYCVPLPFIMLRKVEENRDLLILKWIKAFKHYHQVCEGVGYINHLTYAAVSRKLLALWPPDYVVDTVVLKDVMSLLSVITEYVNIETNNFSLGASLGSKQGRSVDHAVDYILLLAKVLKTLSILWSKENITSSRKLSMPIELTMNSFNIVMSFFRGVSSSSTLVDVLGKLASVLSEFYDNCPKNKQMEQKLENMLQCISDKINTSFVGAYNPDLLVKISPLLVSTLTHPIKGIQDKSKHIFLRTFNSNYGVLSKCDSLKKILQQMKPPLIPNLDMVFEEDISSLSESSQEVIPYESPTRRYGSFLTRSKNDLAQLVSSPKKSPVHLETRRISPRKHAISKTLEEMSQSEFVRIEPAQKSAKSPLTEHQKERRKNLSFVPAMYSDLSQPSQQSSNSQLGQQQELEGANDSFASAKDTSIENIDHSSGSLQIIEDIVPSEKVQSAIVPNSSEKDSRDLPHLDSDGTTRDDSFFSVCSPTSLAATVGISDDNRHKKGEAMSSRCEDGSDDSGESAIELPCGQDLCKLIVMRSVKKDQKIKATPVLAISKLKCFEVENTQQVELENLGLEDRTDTEKLRTQDESSPKLNLRNRTKPLPVFPKLSRASLGNIENIPEDEDIIPSSLSSFEDSVLSEKPARKPKGNVTPKSLRSGKRRHSLNSWSTADDLRLSTESSLSSIGHDPILVGAKSPLTTKNIKEPQFTKIQETRSKKVKETKTAETAVENFGLRMRRRRQYLELAGKRKRRSSVENRMEESEKVKRPGLSKKKFSSSQENLEDSTIVSKTHKVVDELIVSSMEMASTIKQRKQQSLGGFHEPVHDQFTKDFTSLVTRSKAKNRKFASNNVIGSIGSNLKNVNDLEADEALPKRVCCKSSGNTLSKELNSVCLENQGKKAEITADVHEMDADVSKNAPANFQEIEPSVVENARMFQENDPVNRTANIHENQSNINTSVTTTCTQETELDGSGSSSEIQVIDADMNVNGCPTKNSKGEVENSESSTEKLLTEMGLASRTPSNESSDLIEIPVRVIASTAEKPSSISGMEVNKNIGAICRDPVSATVVISDQDYDGSSEKSSTLSDENLLANPAPEFLEMKIDTIESESSREQTVTGDTNQGQKLDEPVQSFNPAEATEIPLNEGTSNSIQIFSPPQRKQEKARSDGDCDGSSQNSSTLSNENLLVVFESNANKPEQLVFSPVESESDDSLPDYKLINKNVVTILNRVTKDADSEKLIPTECLIREASNLCETGVLSPAESESDESLPGYKLMKKTESLLARNVVTILNRVTEDTDSENLIPIECQIRESCETAASLHVLKKEDQIVSISSETVHKHLEDTNFDDENSANTEVCQISAAISEIVVGLTSSDSTLNQSQVSETVPETIDLIGEKSSLEPSSVEFIENEFPKDQITQEANHDHNESVLSSNSYEGAELASSEASSNSTHEVPALPEQKRRKRRKAYSPVPSPVSTRLRVTRKRMQEVEKQKCVSKSSRQKNSKSKRDVETFSQAWKNISETCKSFSDDEKLSPVRVFKNSRTSPMSRSHFLLQASIQKGNSPRLRTLQNSMTAATQGVTSPSGVGILKRQKEDQNEDDGSEPVKRRKVWFADPIVQEHPASKSEGNRSPQVKRCLQLSSNIKSQEESLTPSPTLSDVCGESSQEIEDSQSAVFPELIDCPDPLDAVLPHLTSSLWSRGLEQLLRSRNIMTVGHLSRLTLPEVQNLPLRSPKVKHIQKVLAKHLSLQKKMTSFDLVTSKDRIICKMDDDPEQPFPPLEHVSPSDSSDDEPLPSMDAALLELGAMEIENNVQDSDFPIKSRELSKVAMTELTPAVSTAHTENEIDLQLITMAEPIDSDAAMATENVQPEVEVFVTGKTNKMDEVVLTTEPVFPATTVPFSNEHTEREQFSVGAATSLEVAVTEMDEKVTKQLAETSRKAVPGCVNLDSVSASTDRTDSETHSDETVPDLITETTSLSLLCNPVDLIQSVGATENEEDLITKTFIKFTSKDVLYRLKPSVMLEAVENITQVLRTVVKDYN